MGCKVRIRFIIMALIFFTAFVAFTVRSNLSIILPAMVYLHDEFDVPECVKDKTSHVNNTINRTTVEPDDYGPKYHWDNQLQGLLLAGYFYGFVIGNVPGGPIAQHVGPFWTILIGIVVSGVVNVICVWLIPIHWTTLFGARLLIGLSGGIVYPGIHNLIGQWAPPQERAKFVSCLMGSSFGTSITWIITGTVIKHFQWPWGFYVGSICFIPFCIAYVIFASDSPDGNKWITPEELEYIKASQQGTVTKSKGAVPYKAILTSFPFWTMCVLHCGSLYGQFVQVSAVPKYIKEYVGFDIKNSGFVSSLPNLGRLICGIICGIIADYLKKKQYRRVIILKMFILLSHIIPGICFVLISVGECNVTFLVSMLVLSMSMNGATVVTNLSNPTDLSPNYAGSIFAIINAIATMSGFLVPSITGAVLTAFGNTHIAWSGIFALGGFMYCGTGIFFIIFGSADIQPWNDKLAGTDNTP